MTKIEKLRVKREVWNKKAYWVIRKNGKIETKTVVKGSKLKNKLDVLQKYKKSSSISPNIFQKEILGKKENINYIVSKKKVTPNKSTQILIDYEIFLDGFKLNKTVTGYSKVLTKTPKDKRVLRYQIRRKAEAVGIEQELFTYDDNYVLVEVKGSERYVGYEERG
ncbi:MAG: hypothetical protein R6U15_03760 [Candidatus Izemoplasmatales bacterium]